MNKSNMVFFRTVVLLITLYLTVVFLIQNNEMMNYQFWSWQVNLHSSYVHAAGILLGYVVCKLINYKPEKNYFR